MRTARATKAQTEKVIRAINRQFETDLARLIDWTSSGDGYAIAVDSVDAIEVSMYGAIQDSAPKGGFIEPITSSSLRVYRTVA